MFKNLKTIYKHNHNRTSSLLIYTLFLEKSNVYIIKKCAIVIRKYLLSPIFNIQISPSSFEKNALLSLRLPHPFNIIIHGNSKIGCNCTLYHEVTIGCRENISQKSPLLEDNVYVGCKSALLGDIVIRTNTTIGACTQVFSSTPRNSKICGLYK